MTYYRPAGPRQGVKWTDNLGRSGQVAYLGQFHAQDYYYPLWLEEESHTCLLYTSPSPRDRG